MTGPFIGAAGLVTAPGYAFNGAANTGFYLAGANQIGITTNGIQAATVNSDQSVTFAGTISAKGTIPIGAVTDFAGASAPAGWLLCFGQLVSTTTYAALFVVLSTTYGSGAGTFGIPDYRGLTLIGKDNMGGSTAGRITAAVNYNGTILGNSGGAQVNTLITGNLPAYTPSGSVSTPTATTTINFSNLNVGAGGTQIFTPAAGSGSTTTGAVTTVSTPSFSGNAMGGSSTPITNLPPSIITNKIMYAGV